MDVDSRRYSSFLVVPQVERRHRLIEELRLSAPRTVTGASLAETVGFSVRTVERDLAELIEAGVPITIHRGPGGGYGLLFAATPIPVPLSAGEISALIVSLVAIGPSSSATAQSALAKLLGAVSATPSGRPIR